MWRVLRFVALGAIVAAVILSRPQRNTVTEDGSYDDSVEGELGRFIQVINTVNSEEDQEYVAAVKRLREASGDVIAEARRLLMDRADTTFATRHSAIMGLGALQSEDALDLLSEVALNPQPLPPMERPMSGSSLDEFDHLSAEEAVQGEMLALDAIDGIEALADGGSDKAIEVLVRATALSSNSIRGAAFAALGARPDRRAHLDRAAAALPKELRHLVRLRRVAVEDAPQIRDPRVHLASPHSRSTGAPSLPGARGDRGADAPARGAPVISRGGSGS